jgi:hypothetical protein
MPEGAGMFYLVGLLVIAPFVLVRDLVQMRRRRQQRQAAAVPLSPLEINLRLASWGAAFITLPLAILWRAGLDRLGVFLSTFTAGARLLFVAGGILWFAVAFVCLVTGWRACAGPRNGLLVLRAFGKLTLGAFGLYWWALRDAAPAGDPFALVLLLAVLWLLVTGLVRFLILARLRSAALGEVEGDIAAREFDWDQ